MNQRRQRLILVGVFALFFIPVISAWVLRHNPVLFGTVNKGILLETPRVVSALGLQVQHTPYPDTPLLTQTWSVITVAGRTCDTNCNNNLYATRQARAGVNQNYDRVRRILVVTQTLSTQRLELLTRGHPDVTVVVAMPHWLHSLQGDIPHGPDTFVVDPRGFLFMTYPVPTQSADILKDLRRLLKISAVG
jgi:hypothetical protein